MIITINPSKLPTHLQNSSSFRELIKKNPLKAREYLKSPEAEISKLRWNLENITARYCPNLFIKEWLPVHLALKSSRNHEEAIPKLTVMLKKELSVNPNSDEVSILIGELAGIYSHNTESPKIRTAVIEQLWDVVKDRLPSDVLMHNRSSITSNDLYTLDSSLLNRIHKFFQSTTHPSDLSRYICGGYSGSAVKTLIESQQLQHLQAISQYANQRLK